MTDVPFLRGRAEVYRRMARTTPNANIVDDFLRLAADCEEQAAALERELPQERVSIRKHLARPSSIRRSPALLRTA